MGRRTLETTTTAILPPDDEKDKTILSSSAVRNQFKENLSTHHSYSNSYSHNKQSSAKLYQTVDTESEILRIGSEQKGDLSSRQQRNQNQKFENGFHDIQYDLILFN